MQSVLQYSLLAMQFVTSQLVSSTVCVAVQLVRNAICATIQLVKNAFCVTVHLVSDALCAAVQLVSNGIICYTLLADHTYGKRNTVHCLQLVKWNLNSVNFPF